MFEVRQSSSEKEKVVKLNRAEMEPLTAYDEEFFIQHVAENQDVLVGRGLADGDFYLRCDFLAFAEKLRSITPEKLEELFLVSGKLEHQAPEADENTRRLLNTCWRVARIARNLLGDVGSEIQRNESFSKYESKTEDNKKVCVKPLSKCSGEAVCSEYSLVAHHVLEKLGIQSSVVVGAFSDDPKDSLAGRHTFLVLENGKYIFDPTHTAQQEQSWPPKVLSPEIPFTIESLKDMSIDDNQPFGRKIMCTDLLTKEKKIYGSGAA